MKTASFSALSGSSSRTVSIIARSIASLRAGLWYAAPTQREHARAYNMKWVLVLGFAGLALAACKPQSASRPFEHATIQTYVGEQTAIDVQQSNGARHVVAIEGLSGQHRLNLWRNEGTPIAVLPSSSTSLGTLDVAAVGSGTSYIIWSEFTSGNSTVKWTTVSTGGTVAAAQTLATAPYVYDARIVRAGNSVYAMYVTASVARGSQSMYYRQLAPTLGSAVLVAQTASSGLDLSETDIVGDKEGMVHLSWRTNPTYTLGFGAAFYARGNSGALLGSTQVISMPNGAVRSPRLAVDDRDAVVRAHVALVADPSAGSGDSAIRVARYDDGALATTRVYTLNALDGWSQPFFGELDVTVNIAREPFVGFIAAQSGTSPDAWHWNYSSAPVRHTTTGNAVSVRAASVISGSNYPVMAYALKAGDAAGVYVYDWLYQRTVPIWSGALCGIEGCPSRGFDFAAFDTMTAGSWLAIAPGTGRKHAYSAYSKPPTPGQITVNTAADNTNTDDFITLREALQIANGTRTGGFSVTERALLTAGGCQLNGSGTIIAACGRAISDTIIISTSTRATINLNSALGVLPPLSDTAPTSIFADSGGLTLLRGSIASEADIVAPAGFAHGLLITSAGNSVEGIGFIGAQIGLSVTGSSNDLGQLRAYSNSIAGIAVSGDFNFIYQPVVGGQTAGMRIGSCAQRSTVGIQLGNGSENSAISGGAVGCASTYGIELDGADASKIVINDVDVGGGYLAGSYTAIPNLSSGIYIHGGSSRNALSNIVAGSNGQHGILISGGSSTLNVVRDSQLVSNTNNGVRISGALTVELTNSLVMSNAASGIVLGVAGNGGHRIISNTIVGNARGIFATPTRNSDFEQNRIYENSQEGIYLDTGTTGVFVYGSDIYRNGGNGVLLSGSGVTGNEINESKIMSNGIGIREQNGATGNVWSDSDIFGNTGLGIDKGVAGVTAPAISVTGFNATTRQVQFSVTDAATSLEVFSPVPDPSGYGEGMWLGNATSAGAGTFTYVLPAGQNCVTAISHSSAGSSEFAQNWCNSKPVFLPAVVR